MSLQGMQFIIGRAVTDAGFRENLKADPEFMVENVKKRWNYDFTDEEVQALKAMNWDELSGVGNELDQRISRMRRSSVLEADPQPTCSCTPESGSNPDK